MLYRIWLLGTFTEMRKATINFVMSVSPHGTSRLSLGSFHEILIFKDFFENLPIKSQFH
jgi:hypothetical protein